MLHKTLATAALFLAATPVAATAPATQVHGETSLLKQVADYSLVSDKGDVKSATFGGLFDGWFGNGGSGGGSWGGNGGSNGGSWGGSGGGSTDVPAPPVVLVFAGAVAAVQLRRRKKSDEA